MWRFDSQDRRIADPDLITTLLDSFLDFTSKQQRYSIHFSKFKLVSIEVKIAWKNLNCTFVNDIAHMQLQNLQGRIFEDKQWQTFWLDIDNSFDLVDILNTY